MINNLYFINHKCWTRPLKTRWFSHFHLKLHKIKLCTYRCRIFPVLSRRPIIPGYNHNIRYLSRYIFYTWVGISHHGFINKTAGLRKFTCIYFYDRMNRDLVIIFLKYLFIVIRPLQRKKNRKEGKILFSWCKKKF